MKTIHEKGIAAVLLILAACAHAPRTAASADPTPAFQRLAIQRLHILRQDPQIAPMLDGGSEASALVGPAKTETFARLTDAQLKGFIQLFVQTLDQANPATCDSAVRGRSPASFFSMAMHADSATAAGWVDLFVSVLRAKATDVPVGHYASNDEVYAIQQRVAKSAATT